MRADGGLHSASLKVLDLHRAQFAVSFFQPKDDCLADAAASGVLAFRRVLVALFSAHECFVGLDRSRQRTVEGFCCRRVAEPMQHEPRRLLRDLDILRQLRAGDALFVRRDKPNGDEPLPERNFRVLEDCSDLDRKPLAAVAALVSALVAEMVDLRRAAVRAIGASFPPDRPEMVDCRLFVRERLSQFKQAVELLKHGVSPVTP